MSARIDRIASVVEDHMLTGPAPGQCRCGWGQEPAHLGKSHAEHVARMILAELSEADSDRGEPIGRWVGHNSDELHCTACSWMRERVHPRDRDEALATLRSHHRLLHPAYREVYR